jgi:hypothetical protein
MNTASALELVRKIAFLEERLGKAVRYEILEPFALDQHDLVQIQVAAKRIADFVQLKDLVFVVGIVTQQQGTLGNVEVAPGQDAVFIEIAPETMEFDGAVCGVLAHEISHKYLDRYGVSYSSNPSSSTEDEILTDVTAVFLGLGKLILNGCERQKTREEMLSGGVERTTTETYRAGYLDPAQFAFVYRFVCAMRGVPRAELERGLSTTAINTLRECENSWPIWFADGYHSHNTRLRILGSLQAAIQETQAEMAIVDRSLTYLQRGCLEPVESWSQSLHRRVNAIRSLASRTDIAAEYDPCLRYINTAQFNQLLTEVIGLSRRARSAQDTLLRLEGFVASQGEPFMRPNSEMFTVIICRNCGIKLRVPRDTRNATVVCRSCRYAFKATSSVSNLMERNLRRKARALIEWVIRKVSRK